jgi:hypothetical protein
MTAKTEYQSTSQKSKPNPRKHNQIPLDADFWADPKFAGLIQEQGWAAAGLILAVAGYLWRDHCNLLAFSELKQIAWTLHTTEQELLSAVEGAIRTELFERANEICFYCPFISKAAYEYSERVDKLRSNGKLGGRPDKGPEKPIANQLVSTNNQLVNVNNQLVSTRNQTQDNQDNQDRKTIKQSEGGAGGNDCDLQPESHPLERYFMPVTVEVERDPQFMNAGRRPLKDFTAIWLTPFELEQVREEIKKHPSASMKSIFTTVQARAVGRPPHERSKFCAHAALTGWALQAELEKQKAVNDAARSAVYLQNATGEA